MEKLANPAPLGLMGFGMTTVLLSLHNAGIIALGSMILAMGIFFGGMTQVLAGILEFKKEKHLRNNSIYFIRGILADFSSFTSNA